jgi:PAS domain S-box-containing protein
VLQPASILPRSLAARYAVAIVAVGIAFLLALAFPVLLGALPLFTFVPAILVTAAVSGFGAASLATLLATVAIQLVFLPNGDALQAERLLVFDGYCLMLSGILAAYRLELLRMRGEQIRNLELVATTTRDLSLRLEEERARLQTMVSSVPGVVWEAWGQPDRSSQRIDFVSEHVTRMVGYTVDEWQGTPNFWLTIVHPDDRQMAAENAARHRAAGGPGMNAFRWITKDGRAIDVESHSTVIADENGQPLGMRGVTLDVTARRRAEESLRLLGRVSDLLAASLDVHTTLRNAASMAVPILGDLCMIDLVEGDIIRRVAAHHADPEKQPLAERLLSFSPDAQAKHGSAEAIRTMKPVYGDRIPRDLLDSLGLVSEHRQLAQTIGVESHMIVPMESRGRAVGAIHFSSPHIAHYGESDRELATHFARRVALAIDNAQLYQAAVEASRARDQFLATVSHELRTPMTATLGWVRMMTGGHLDDDTRVLALDAIDRSTRAQAHLIEDILDVSSIVTGKFRLETGPVDLPAIIDNAVGTLMPAAEAKQIAIEIDSRGWTGVLQGDENRLQQVIWNLVSNAIKFSRRGGHIGVRLRRAEGLARLTVCDDGAGIDGDFLPHVFERFRQADASLTRMHGGLGLGLAIVRHLVELHGGTVRAESAGSDQGATFTIELPLATSDHVFPDVATNSVLPRLDALRVLVVDDEADARAIVSAVLRSCGAAVTTASSAREALLALDQPHDLLITDIAMPDGDGFTLMQTLRGRGTTTKAIALTAIADAAHHPGAAAFERILRKPIDPIDLARAVAPTFRSPVTFVVASRPISKFSVPLSTTIRSALTLLTMPVT